MTVPVSDVPSRNIWIASERQPYLDLDAAGAARRVEVRHPSYFPLRANVGMMRGMGKMFTALDDRLTAFIAEQKIFFTATAPDEGRINVSPKGIDSFRCLDHRTVAYLDLTGSGNEASAHLRENGRMTIMFCSFNGSPLILRLYGRGRSVHPQDEEWTGLIARFDPQPGQRQIVVLDIDSVQTSCGFGVPQYEFREQRTLLPAWAEKQGADGLADYWRNKGRVSIDGLPTALPVPAESEAELEQPLP